MFVHFSEHLSVFCQRTFESVVRHFFNRRANQQARVRLDQEANGCLESFGVRLLVKFGNDVGGFAVVLLLPGWYRRTKRRRLGVVFLSV